jgi:hypothetical protein
MGRRSRKRATDPSASARTPETRAERDAARRERARAGREHARPSGRARPGRTSIDDRPPPLWGSFPLTELIILAGIVLMVWGFASGSGREGDAKIAAGLAIAALAGLELAIREHVTGFRSHTTLLAGAAALLTVAALSVGVGLDALGVLLAGGVLSFAGAFYGLRELFKRRSGGLGFR